MPPLRSVGCPPGLDPGLSLGLHTPVRWPVPIHLRKATAAGIEIEKTEEQKLVRLRPINWYLRCQLDSPSPIVKVKAGRVAEGDTHHATRKARGRAIEEYENDDQRPVSGSTMTNGWLLQTQCAMMSGDLKFWAMRPSER